MSEASAVVALAALVTALGGTPGEADAVTHYLSREQVGNSPGHAIETVSRALKAVRANAERVPDA